MTTRNSTNYTLISGWTPDKHDERDYPYRPKRRKSGSRRKDLRPVCPPMYNQRKLGSCTGNGVGKVYHFDELKQGLADAFMPSRLFIYWNERFIDGTVNKDAGSEIRTGIKTIAKQGVCSEAMWPYFTTKFRVKPSPECYKEALKHRAVTYMRVQQDLDHLKACLDEGYPIVFGFNVFASFMSKAVAKTGMVPMPKPKEKNVGGHCVVIVGYDDDMQCFIVCNSWGEEWGDKGYCYMPYAYITNKKLADDFWTVRLVSDLQTVKRRKLAEQRKLAARKLAARRVPATRRKLAA